MMATSPTSAAVQPSQTATRIRWNRIAAYLPKDAGPSAGAGRGESGLFGLVAAAFGDGDAVEASEDHAAGGLDPRGTESTKPLLPQTATAMLYRTS
jgi:hypothetical protein